MGFSWSALLSYFKVLLSAACIYAKNLFDCKMGRRKIKISHKNSSQNHPSHATSQQCDEKISRGIFQDLLKTFESSAMARKQKSVNFSYHAIFILESHGWSQLDDSFMTLFHKAQAAAVASSSLSV
jgi:hypothetical protein